MNTNNKKAYKKALRLYEKGECYKALKICDYEIANNINNSLIINLKGLILYITGNLNEAKQLWKLNFEANNDTISEKYLISITHDKDKEELYVKASKLFDENKIRLAIQELNKCLESDFNSINVNILYAKCLIKTAQYNKANLAIEKVLSIDKKNKEAANLNKTMIKLGVINRKNNVFIKGCLVASIILIGFISIKEGLPLIRGLNEGSEATETLVTENKVSEDVLDKNKETEEEEEKEKQDTKVQSFDKNELINNVKNKNYKSVDKILSEYDINKLSINEKSVYDSAIKFMKEEGLQLCYEDASNILKENNFLKADELLSIAEKYAENNYLMEHILYFRASCNEKAGDIEKALKFYKNYTHKYPRGEYDEEVVYRLAFNYDKIDKEEAKKYARKIQDEFSDSMYNNSVIKNILN